MTNENIELINQLKDKISFVISLYEEEKQKNDNLKQENERLQEELTRSAGEIEKWEDKYHSLQLVKEMTADGHLTEQTKKKMKKIVREIDKCIAHLND